MYTSTEEKCTKCQKRIRPGKSRCYINNNLFCLDCAIDVKLNTVKSKKDEKEVK